MPAKITLELGRPFENMLLYLSVVATKVLAVAETLAMWEIVSNDIFLSLPQEVVCL